MKFAILLLLGVVACGVPPAEVRAVKDQQYSMSLQKVADRQDRYHFQICRLAVDGEEQHCFNPFVVDGETAVEFSGQPDVKYLQIEGVTKKTTRYTAHAVLAGAIGALILVFVPKAVRYSFSQLFKISRAKTSKALRKPFKHEILEKRMIVEAKGQEWTEKMTKKEEKKDTILDSKWVKILASLFIVEGAFDAVEILYEQYKTLNQGLANGQWGDKELELVKVYPQLISDTQGEATVDDLSRLAETLRQHLGLAFSDAYLMEFAKTTN